MNTLKGKTALVTGAGRGIGQAIAFRLAKEGANVVVNDLDADPAEETVETIKKAGGTAIAFPGSVTEEGFAEKFVQTALETYGDINIIVNNAGYTWDNVIHKMSDKQWDAMMDVHVKAPFRILRAAAPHFRATAKKEASVGIENFRKVVNISSIAGTGGNPGQANYSSAKSAVIGLTKTLSKEWGRFKVNVNCVAFGWIETRLTAAVHGDKKAIEVEGNSIPIGIPAPNLAGMKMMVPLGRPGTVEEAAAGVYLLCSPDSNYISGQTLVVGGGISF
jgi:3-oxoacyl-[acyl-carrier protein] reductase